MKNCWPHSSPALLLVIAGFASLAAGCRQVPEDAVAVWDEGFVSRTELEDQIRRLPVEERRPEDGDFESWLSELARRAALEEIFTDQARRAGVAEEADVRHTLAEARRDLLAKRYLDRHPLEIEAVTEAAVEELYTSRSEQYQRPARRATFHLFRRTGGVADRKQVRTALEELRERVLAGESFQVVARHNSQSETRHRDGFLGTFQPSDLNDQLRKVVFALPVKTPSAPILTAEGGHLFWVETASEERTVPLGDVRADLLRELQTQRRTEALRRLTSGQDLTEDSFVPSEEELAVLLQSGQAQSLVLRAGAYELRLAELIEKLDEAPKLVAESRIAHAGRVVEWLVQREKLSVLAEASGLAEEERLTNELARLEHQELARRWARRLMLERALGDDEQLNDFFAQNAGRYSEPLRFRFERLAVPIRSSRPVAVMAKLERLSEERQVDRERLEAVAAELGGTLQDLPWATLEQLGLQSEVAKLVAPLEEGEVSPPFRTERQLQILRAAERRDPLEQPLAAVREQVAADLVVQRGQDLLAELSEAVLQERQLQVVGRALAEMVGSVATVGPGSP